MPSSLQDLVRWALTAPSQLIQLVDIPDVDRGKFPELDAAEMLMRKAYEPTFRTSKNQKTRGLDGFNKP